VTVGQRPHRCCHLFPSSHDFKSKTHAEIGSAQSHGSGGERTQLATHDGPPTASRSSMGLDGCIELGQGNTQASAVGVDNKIDVSQ